MERPSDFARLAPTGTCLFRQEAEPNFPELSHRVMEHCRAIRDLSVKDAFPLHSTRRQFQRYLDFWQRNEWRDLAAAAVGALSQGEPQATRVYRRPGKAHAPDGG